MQQEKYFPPKIISTANLIIISILQNVTNLKEFSFSYLNIASGGKLGFLIDYIY